MVSPISEDELVDRIRRRWSGAPAPRGSTGIGDDAAVLALGGRPGTGPVIVTADLFIEGVHFDLAYTPAFCIGRKALLAAASDVGAMGGVPTGCLVSLGVPRRARARLVDEILESIHAGALELGIPVLGGDLSRAHGHVMIDVIVLGRPAGTRVVKRDGARPGHALYVTGPLGGSAAGLDALRAHPRLAARLHRALRMRRPPARAGADVLAAYEHLSPRPPLAAGAAFGRSGWPTAMMDLSDGLAVDLRRMCRASGAGAIVDSDRIPLHPAAVERLGPSGALKAALGGGEDYQLLLAAPPRREGGLRRLAAGAGADLVHIGTVTRASAGLRLAGPRGSTRPLPRAGFDHFARTKGSGSRRGVARARSKI